MSFEQLNKVTLQKLKKKSEIINQLNYKPKPMYILGQTVKIKLTPAAYASDQTGILKGVKENGFVVEIETEIPKPGVVPSKELKKHEVWAESIEII